MKKFFENFIMLAIVLVLFQTLLEEISVIYDYSYNFKELLIYTGFFFDLVFSIEFFTRLILSAKQSKIKNYLTEGLGWIDFLSSVPLLFFNSGLMVYFLLTRDISGAMGASGLVGILSILKVVKVVRVSRILRMMRFLKLLKNLHFIKSKITQRHTNFILTTVISFILLMIVILNITSIWNGKSLNSQKNEHFQTLMAQSMQMSITYNKDFLKILVPILKKDSEIFDIQYQKKSIYTKNVSVSLLEVNHIESFKWNRLSIFYLDKNTMQLEARFQLVVILMIIGVIIGVLLLYARKFALEISDTIQIVEKGISEPDYFLKIKENEDKDDEIETLSRTYNEVWLPIKLKNQDKIYETEDEKLLEEADDINLEELLGEDI